MKAEDLENLGNVAKDASDIFYDMTFYNMASSMSTLGHKPPLQACRTCMRRSKLNSQNECQKCANRRNRMNRKFR